MYNAVVKPKKTNYLAYEDVMSHRLLACCICHEHLHLHHHWQLTGHCGYQHLGLLYQTLELWVNLLFFEHLYITNECSLNYSNNCLVPVQTGLGGVMV